MSELHTRLSLHIGTPQRVEGARYSTNKKFDFIIRRPLASLFIKNNATSAINADTDPKVVTNPFLPVVMDIDGTEAVLGYLLVQGTTLLDNMPFPTYTALLRLVYNNCKTGKPCLLKLTLNREGEYDECHEW